MRLAYSTWGVWREVSYRNKQIIEKLEEELICIEQEKATAIELLNVEQTKSKTKDLSNKSIIIKEDKSLMCDLS